MKRLTIIMVWGIPLLFALSVNAIGCTPKPNGDLIATEQAETIAAGVASIMAAFVAETRAAELIMTQVAGTITAMPTNTQPAANETPEEYETPVPLDVIQTSVAATVMAELTLTPPQLGDSLMQLQVRGNASATAINVRRGPDTCFTVVASLQKGRVVTVLGRNADRSWYLVELANGMAGWVWAELTEFVGVDAANQVPLANNIPTCPPPSRTATISTPSATPQGPSGSTPTTMPTIGPTPTSLPTPTSPACSYPPCITPTVGPTPTPRDPYPYP